MDTSEIVNRYEAGDSLKGIAARAGITYSVVRRILITEGVELRDCPQADIIQAMAARGMSTIEIAQALDITRKTVGSYMPYRKGSYAVGEKSANAMRIQACRERKRVKGEQHMRAPHPVTYAQAQKMVDLVEAGKLDELAALAAGLEPMVAAYDAASPMHCDECGAVAEPDELRQYAIDGKWQSLCSFCGADRYPTDAALCFRGQARETLRIIREWAPEVKECSDDDDIYHMIRMEALALWDITPMEDKDD